MGKKKAAPKAPKAPKQKRVRGLKDQEVADFLAKFRGRDEKDQQASPIWQELVAFPGWGMGRCFFPSSPSPTPSAATWS